MTYFPLKYYGYYKKTILFIAFFAFWSVLTAQNYRYTVYNTETSDLPQNQVMSLFQDSRGNIWVGTKFGVVRYDGQQFKIYSPQNGLTAGDIQWIFETKEGAILLCSVQGGITKIMGGQITSYPKYGKYRSYQFYQIKDSLFIWAQYLGKKNKFLLFSFFKGNYKLLNPYIERSGYFSNYLNDTIWTTYKDSKGKYHLAYLDKKHKITKRKLNIETIHALKQGDTLYLYNYWSVYKYRDGKISKLISGKHYYFFKTTPTGIYLSERANRDMIKKYDYSGKQTDMFHIPDFRNVMTDKEGNTWFATENGLYKLAEKAFHHFVFSHYGLNISNPGIIIDKDDKPWLSSFNGKLYKLEDNRFVDYSGKLPYKKPAFIISRLLKPDGTLIWGGSTVGVVKKKGKSFVHNKLNGISTIYGLYYDSLAKQCLYGHRHGVLIEDDKGRIVLNIDTVKNIGTVLDMDKDTAGYYWIANRRHVYKLKNKRVSRVSTPKFMTGAYDILHDSRHNLWFGGESGLIFFNNKNFKKIDHPSLINKAVTALHELGDSVLLIGTTAGMATLDLRSFYDKNKVVMKFYNNRNGFSGNECAQTGFSEDKNGFVWIPVNDRLIKIDPRRLSFENIHVKPYISSMSVIKNDVWTTRDTAVHELAYDEDRIRFRFSGPYFSNPVSYSYFLKGYDNNWSGYGNTKEATYSNLPKGKYTFYVKAANGDESGKVLKASYSFNIKPAIWETTGFYILSFLFISGLVYLIIKKQIKRKTEKQRRFYEQNKLMMRTQMAQLDPHFIFNTLTTTGTFALRMKQIGIYDIIVRFSKLLRTHWNNNKLTRTLEEELGFIDEYCALNRINHSERFDYFIKTAENVDTSVKVLKLSLQNFVENAIKYGIESITGKGLININVSQDETYTKISIEDNGIGYNKSIKKKTHRSRTGIITIRSTFDLYNSWNKYKLDFKIIDKSDIMADTNGTIVTITVPNNYKYSPD